MDFDKNLAPYAQKCKYSKGRRYKEEESTYRTPFQRDRDRIIHTSAFRRLEHKTQVLITTEGDYYRTRLTHTIEVSQIARTIGKTLCLNEELIEAISLAHDLGHTPFGHAGEEVLHNLMKDHGGFEHNRQSLRIVDLLEERYVFPGLNLTWEVREGIAKHKTSYDNPVILEFSDNKMPSLEAQVVNIADEIAFVSHDLDDSIKSGIVIESEFNQSSLYTEIKNEINKRFKKMDNKRIHYQIIRRLIDVLITDVIENSISNLKNLDIMNVDEVRNHSTSIISFSKPMKEKLDELKRILFEKFYNNYQIETFYYKAQHIVSALFRHYTSNPQMLPLGYQKKINGDDIFVVVADYVSGMTDRYAIEEYKKIFVI